MTYRSDVDALAARTDALAAEVATKTRELDTARSLLDEAVAKSRLPVLPNIRVATPCSADWAQMTGDERVRACASCDKNVYNLSSLTREEAEALILEKEGRLCVRYFQRTDGTILLKDCSVGIRQKRKRRMLAAGVVALLGGSAFASLKLSRTTPCHSPLVDVTPSPEEHPVPNIVQPQQDPPEPLEDIRGQLALPDTHVTMGAAALPVDPPPAHDTK